MLTNLFFIFQLSAYLGASAIMTIILGILLCDLTNKICWLPIIIYLVIMWGGIIAANFVDIQLVLRAVL